MPITDKSIEINQVLRNVVINQSQVFVNDLAGNLTIILQHTRRVKIIARKCAMTCNNKSVTCKNMNCVIKWSRLIAILREILLGKIIFTFTRSLYAVTLCAF